MKTTLAAAAAILIAANAAGSAADMPMKAPYAAPAPIWTLTGFYIGGHVGAGWGTTKSTLTSVTGGGGGILVGGDSHCAKQQKRFPRRRTGGL